MLKKSNILFSAIVIIFIFLRIYHLPESLNFGTDQGIHLLEIRKIITSGKLTLIGPTASLSNSGRYVFTGPMMYYLTLPILLISSWNIISVSYFMIFLQLAVLVILYLVIRKVFNNQIALLFSLIYSLLPMMVDYSRFLWNPNFLIPISGILLLNLLLLNISRKTNFLIILFGFLCGFGMQMHFTFILAALLGFIWLLITKKINVISLLLLTVGFIIGFLPIIFFEFRHNLYNMRTLVFIFSTKNQEKSTFGLSPHYLLSLLPFIIFFLSNLLFYLYKISKFIVIIILLTFVIYSTKMIIPVPNHGFTMPDGWNYQGIRKIEKIILSENQENFNIVDILSGDTRAMALRSLLIIGQKAPLDFDKYPFSENLFIYSKDPIDKILSGNLWEINSVKPGKVVKSWYIQNGIYLYLVRKNINPHISSS